jgi:hypothetical protein
VSNASGKLVILAIVAIALASGAISWWFRYSATHKAAEFWGVTDSRLIRDAPDVTLSRFNPTADSKPRDISKAPGITHLRNALLEDRSFHWGKAIEMAPKRPRWTIEFNDPATARHLVIYFTSDCRGAIVGDGGTRKRVVSTEPISKGLCQVFAELLPDVDSASR